MDLYLEDYAHLFATIDTLRDPTDEIHDWEVARSALANSGDAEHPPAARELAATLGAERIGAYHAGLTKEERAQIEQWFFSAGDAVLVATFAYGIRQGSCINGFLDRI